jgi:hypothetical protein
MHQRARVRSSFAVGVAGLITAAACSPAVDLSKALEVTDVVTGYADEGVHDTRMDDGRVIPANKLKPSITFALRNTTSDPLTSIEIMASFWQAGGDGEWDSIQTYAVSGSQEIAAGQKSAALTLKPNVAYNVEGARVSLFTHFLYKDVTVKLFAKRSGGLYRLGEFKVDRVLLPAAAGRGASSQ